MRDRTRTIAIPSGHNRFYMGNDQERYAIPFGKGQGWFGYNADCSTGIFRKETISDQTSPGGKFTYNPVIHTLSVPAGFGGNSKVLTYSNHPNTPNCSVEYASGLMMYSPSITRPAGPWGGMLDDLAALADGKVSDACMLPVTLLELGKTVAMVRNPFSLLKPNWRKVARKRTALSLAKSASNVWLEGYYGWKSAYQDVCSVAKATHAFLSHPATRALEEGESSRLSVTRTTRTNTPILMACGIPGSFWNSKVYQSTWSWGISGDYSYCLFRLRNVSDTVAHTFGCRKFQDARERISQAKRILRYAGAGSWRDVRDTIWEVVPYSFVLDWFVDARGIWAPLNKWRLTQADIRDVGYSTKRIVMYDVECWHCLGLDVKTRNATVWGGKTPDGGNRDGLLMSTSKGWCKSYARYPGFPPTLPVDATFLSHGLSRTQLLNGAALLLQKL